MSASRLPQMSRLRKFSDSLRVVPRCVSDTARSSHIGASCRREFRTAAEAALAGAIASKCLLEQLAAEVRPAGVEEHELRISTLPEKEVRQPHLAAGAHEQVGI